LIKSISSRDNPAFRQLLALATDRAARRQSGQTLLDGEHLLEAALLAGIEPRCLVFSESALASQMGDWARRLPHVPALQLSDSLFKRLSPVDSPSGLLAEIAIPQPADRIDGCVLLLEGIQDPGNLGAILRVAAAAACAVVHLSPGCAEAWSPKCLRGGQGAHFQLAIREQADLLAVAGSLAMPVHAAALGTNRTLYGLDLRGPQAFAFGNEGAGLSAGLRVLCQPFSIPMPGRVESLNVATAVAVCLFERVRQLG
jgi:TrmH family RNA methyltransferase